MNLRDRKFKSLIENIPPAAVDEKKIQETVQKSKAAFYEMEAEGSLSRAEFLYQQSRYIHKRWWAAQGGLLFAVWWILQYMESSFYIQRCLGAAAPIFVVLVIPELWKNRNADAMEVECTTFYSLRQVYAARMILFGLVDLLFLSLFFAAATLTARLSIEELVIQFFIPFNVTCCICFSSFNSRIACSEALSVLLCTVWAAVWIQIVLNEAVYCAISVPVWGVLFAASLLCWGFVVKRGQRKGEMEWEGYKELLERV